MKIKLTLFFVLIAFNILYAQTSKDLTVSLTAVANLSPASITLNWKVDPTASYYAIYKKTRDANKWDSISKVSNTISTYTDLAVVIGGSYEYMVIKRSSTLVSVSYVLAGIQKNLPYNRGKMLLIVDKNYAIPLYTEIKQLENDLRGDGWIVIRHDVNRTDAVTAVKQIILNDFNADQQNVKSVYLLGHIPVPYSGGFDLQQYYPPDGHPDHVGAWPADLYYGTMNESIWTDNSFTNTAGSRTENHNIPGDGKFDNAYIYNDTVTLQVGRVDLFNLPAFGVSDTVLMRRYLNKAHNFKIGINVGQRRGYVSDNFGFMGGEAFASSGWRALTPMFGDSVFTIASGGYFSTLDSKSSQFVYGCGGGSYTSCGGVGATSNFVTDSPLYNFGMLFGSYFGDWDAQDNILRAPLASKGWTLSNSWSGRPYNYYHQMAMGENLGYCIQRSQNNYPLYVYNIYPTFVYISLMGDPSLRMNPVLPVSNVALTNSADKKKTTIRWNKSKDQSVTSYSVYRSPSKSAPFVLSGSVPSSDSIFIDNGPYNGLNYFMVKAIRPETTASGTYWNTSIGVQDTITSINTLGVSKPKQDGFAMYPNPANSILHFSNEFGTDATYDVVVYNVDSKLVMRNTWNNDDSQFQLDISSLMPGVYVVSIRQNGAVIHTEKLIKM